MTIRTLSLPFLALSFLLISGCSTTGSHKTSKDWSQCAMVGGAVWGIPGAAHSLATGGIALAAGALVSGLACATADDTMADSGSLPEPGIERGVPRLYFEFDSSVLNSSNKAMLDDYLEDNYKKSFTIVGHTCDIGSKSYNQSLSVRRAEAVKSYLMEKGIHASKITVKGKGESEPRYANTSEENRMKNRRAEILLMD